MSVAKYALLASTIFFSVSLAAADDLVDAVSASSDTSLEQGDAAISPDCQQLKEEIIRLQQKILRLELSQPTSAQLATLSDRMRESYYYGVTAELKRLNNSLNKLELTYALYC